MSNLVSLERGYYAFALWVTTPFPMGNVLTIISVSFKHRLIKFGKIVDTHKPSLHAKNYRNRMPCFEDTDF